MRRKTAEPLAASSVATAEKSADVAGDSASAASAITVRHSKIHGNGVFAVRKIAAGEFIVEYMGQRIGQKEADRRSGKDPENPFHTFFFSLESGKLIDGAVEGNEARWINHSCNPNCEAREEKGHIYIHALRDIERGEELNYDYGLVIEERHTPKVKQQYECRCGAPDCRRTMLALRSRVRKPRPAAGTAE